jgi:GTP cyclohydrolase I
VSIDVGGAGAVSIEDCDDVDIALAGMRSLLRLMGEDPDRDGLASTPQRVLATMGEYRLRSESEVDKLLSVQFDEHHDEVILVGPVPFTSLCEHHLLPFTGVGQIAYIPGNGRIVGLSKLPRLLDHYAARPQVQERLTTQVADALDSRLAPMGVAVILTATHTCMTLRGVRKAGAQMTTSVNRGAFRDEPAARAELMALIAAHG